MVGKAYSSGCTTCVKRKVKCDELKPKCDICRRSGRICGGFRDKFRVYSTSKYPNGASVPFAKESSYECVQMSSPTRDLETLDLELLDYFEKNINGRGYVNLLSAVRRLTQISSVVTSTFRALCAAALGKQQKVRPIKSLGIELYQDSLVRVQQSINDKDGSMADETLLCILMLSQYEITTATDDCAWRSHLLGAGQLIRYRGPAHAKSWSPELYDNFRIRTIFEALTAGTSTFLQTEEWHCQSQSPLGKLLDVASQIPGTLAQRNDYIINDLMVPNKILGMAKQIYEKLVDWKECNDIKYWSVESYAGDQIFPVVYQYADFPSFLLQQVFCTCMMCLCPCLSHLTVSDIYTREKMADVICMSVQYSKEAEIPGRMSILFPLAAARTFLSGGKKKWVVEILQEFGELYFDLASLMSDGQSAYTNAESGSFCLRNP